ncbi:MAG: hypothetical protein J7K20_05655, partial [Thermodesulfobacterium sp.]|nr:hypothetical protein [Thermodesulfobacterium sp.]
DLLSKRFSWVDKDICEINSENFLYLNKILDKFKNEFSSFLKSAPVPFSFFLMNTPTEKLPDVILRAGKIYLEKALKYEINSILKKSNTYYKIEPWKDFWELILPSTVDPKIEFFYKDVFWYGTKKLCFFCKTPWHDSFNCPSLLDPEPRKTFQSALNFRFENLSRLLWEGINKDELSYDKFKYFYVRNFYLLPEFLKILFYRYENIETWGYFKLDMESPVRGGNLGLGLEYLIKRNLENAKREFLEVEDDFRANIGLALISILQDNPREALYYVEKALSTKTTPFLKSYLLFLKGYFYEYTGEDNIAEDFYKNALEEDFTCLPAFYYYNLLKYKRESSLSEIFEYFNHPYFLYWSYLEPIFIKDQKELEDLLYDKIAEKKEIASQRLKETEDRYHKIKNFLSDTEKRKYEERLSKIRENVHKGGIGLIESAYQRALELDLEFQGHIYKLIQKIKNDFENVRSISIRLSRFWKRYPYKIEDLEFGKKLKNLSSLLQKIELKVNRKDPTGVLSDLISEINTCKKMVENLKIAKEEMARKWNFRMKLADFLKMFSVSEFFITCIYIIIPYLPISGTIKKFFTFPSFIFFSFMLLIICLFFSYSRDYVSE